MAIQQTDWLTIIRHWVHRGGTGYTLPFLVGARLLREGRTEGPMLRLTMHEQSLTKCSTLGRHRMLYSSRGAHS